MNEQQMIPNRLNKLIGIRLKPGLLAAAPMIFFIIFSFWSGVPTGERALPFWIGVAVLLVVVAAIAGLIWHLVFRPLPAGQTVREQPIETRYVLALSLLGDSGMKSGIDSTAFPLAKISSGVPIC